MATFVDTPWRTSIQSANDVKFQQDAAAALLQLYGTPIEAHRILSSTSLAQGDTLEVYESSERTPLSLKAEPFAPFSERLSGWANSHPTYPVQQSPSLGGMPGIDIIPDGYGMHQRKRACGDSSSFWQTNNEIVQEEAHIRCVRCGAHFSAESKFCVHCGAPITEGLHCNVHKHASMGIAIVSLHSVQVRQAILQAGRVDSIAGIKVDLRPHTDKVTKEEILTDIFVAWGHKVEKLTPLPGHEIAKFFDEKHVQFADNDSRSGEEGPGMGNQSTTCSTISSSDEKLSDKEDVDSGGEYATDCQKSHMTPKYVCVEQSSSRGGIGTAPVDGSKKQYRIPYAGTFPSQHGKVETWQEKVKVRCLRCGGHTMTQSRFCGSCGAPITHGEHCNVHKHASMGIAIVSLRDVQVRQAILQAGRVESIAGIRVELRPHTDKVTKEEILTDIFVAWGHKVEKKMPLLEHEIAKFFDDKFAEFADGAQQREEEEDDDGSATCGTISSSHKKASDRDIITATSEPMYIRIG